MGFIPYVFGGASCAYAIKPGSPFELIKQESKSFWSYPDYEVDTKSGMDCSSLILRAAQIAGIPLFYRNTKTLERYLECIRAHVDIEPGDIIWFKGHVIVVSDIEKNTCIEARGYSSRFGKVQEIALKDIFEHIDTFSELKYAFLNNMKLNLLSHTGLPIYAIDQFKILKLTSSLIRL